MQIEDKSNMVLIGMPGAGKSLSDLFEERYPLYKKYADVTISCKNSSQEQVCTEIIKATQTKEGI